MVSSKNGGKTKPSSNKLQQISEAPSIGQTEANCFFGIKSYIKDFYAQKEDSDQESIVGSKGKQVKRYSSSEESETESEDESNRYRKVIKNCDRLKKKSRKKVRKFILYSRDLFNTNDSDYERYGKSKPTKRHLDAEHQAYKSNGKSWSVYVWRSVFIIGCIFLVTGLLMATSFLVTGECVLLICTGVADCRRLIGYSIL